MSKMSGGFLAVQAKRSKERTKVVELENAFRAADKDKSGRISLEEWIEVLRASGQDVSRSDVVEMFRERDKDLSGSMSFEEFCGHETRNELAFKAIDKNGDGYISKKEFRRICPNMTEEQVERAFDKFDADNTGRINYREYCAMLNKRLDKSNRADPGGTSSGSGK